MAFHHRKPPDGLLTSQLTLCIMPQPCIFQDACPNAHSENELEEWKARLKLDDVPLYVEDSTSTLNDHRSFILDKLNELDGDEEDHKSVLTEIIGDQSILCDENLFIMHVDKDKELAWMFTIKSSNEFSDRTLERVFFMNDLPEFAIVYAFYNETDLVKLPQDSKIWENQKKSEQQLRVLIRFCSKKFGNFHQEVVFDFGGFPKVVRKIGVQVANEEMLAQTMKYNPEKYVNNELTWLQNHQVISFDGSSKPGLENIKYPLPPNIENLVIFDAFKYLDATLTKQNYRRRLHTLLYIEEYQRRVDLQSISFQLDEFAVCLDKTKTKNSNNYTANILFDEVVLEDLTRLVGKSTKALIRLNSYENNGEVITNPIVYEVMIQGIVKDTLSLELNETFSKLVLSSAIPVNVDVCFCLIDIFQPMHNVIDKVNLDILYPDITSHKSLPSPLSSPSDSCLSKEQYRAVQVMTDPTQRPPILLLGPFGAGKTRTVATVVKKILADETKQSRILICTHSNSAADHYIEEYFQPLHDQSKVLSDIDHSLVPLRINWEYRYLSSVSDKVLAYCLQDKMTGLFINPNKEDLDKHSIIISTLMTSQVLFNLDLPPNYFTHIFIDEAAQAMEVEAILPILLATKETKIILAGDHMQMGESLSSKVAKDLGLGKSLLERLFEHYPFDANCKLKLLENFRSYKEIVQLSSHLFYEDSLISNRSKPDDAVYPVEFYGVTGVEVLSKQNPSYENIAEATEVLLRLREILKFWEERHVEFDLHSVCVVSFYAAQVRQMRRILRRNDMAQVRVESVNNIQGLEFDILIISTVRTYCDATIFDEQIGKKMGFLSNPKLLNTAITRARYQVVLIGEPVALCSFGECKACWKTILKICDSNDTFHYNKFTYDKLFEVIKDLQNNDVGKSEPSQTTSHHVLTDGVESPKTRTESISSFDDASSIGEEIDCSAPPYNYIDTSNDQSCHSGYLHHFPLFYPLPFGFVHPHPRFRPCFPCTSALEFIPRHHFIDMQDPRASCERFLFHKPYSPRIIPLDFSPYRCMPPYFEDGNLYCQQSYPVNTNSQHNRKSILLLPAAKNLVNLRQKIQFVQEYSLYLLGNIIASSDVKDVVRINTKEAFQKLNNLSENHEVYEPIYLKIKTDEIESSAENIYLHVENQFVEYTKINQTSTQSSPNRTLIQRYGILKKQVLEIQLFLDNEENASALLEDYTKSVSIRKDLNSLSYLFCLLNDQIKTCQILMNGKPVSPLLSAKLEFLGQQVHVAEAHQEQFEQKLAVEKVESLVHENSNSLVSSSNSEDERSVEFSSDSAALNSEMRALEDSLNMCTLNDHDPDVVEWFSKRRNDPYVQEYVTSHVRQFADRLPSPPPPTAENVAETNHKRTNRSTGYGRRFCNKNENISQGPCCATQAMSKSLSSSNSSENTSKLIDNENCDYSMSTPYIAHLEPDQFRSCPEAHEGLIKYRSTEDYDKPHGTVFVNNVLQIHINGLISNNRALPGDTVIIKTRRKSFHLFDVPGDVLCVTRRSTKTLMCRQLNSFLVVPIEHGPPILLIRGVGNTKQTLNPEEVYVVKIIDWPLDMKYALGQIVSSKSR